MREDRVRRKNRLLTDTGHTLGSSLYLLVLGVAISVILARHLGPEGKGAYDLLWVTAHTFATLGGMSLSTGLTYYAARGQVGVGLMLRHLGLFTFALSVLSAVALLGLRRTSAGDLLLPPDGGFVGVVGIVLLIGVLVSTEHWRSIAVGLGRIAATNRRDLIREVLFLALLILVALKGPGILGVPPHLTVLGVAVSAYLVSGVLLFGLVRRLTTEGGGIGFRALLGYSIPAHASNVTQFLNYRLDFFLVSFFGGIAALGHYSVAVGLAQLLWIGSRAAARVLLPAVASRDAGSGAETALVARLSFWTAATGAAAYVLGGRFCIQLLYGSEFLPSHLPLMILLLGTVPFTISNALAAHIGGLGLPQLNLRASLVGLVVTVVLDLLWIPRFGIAGAAAATTVSYVATTAVLLVFFSRLSSIALRDLIVLRYTDVGTVAAIARGAASALFGRRLS